MNCRDEHNTWMDQVLKLKNSLSTLTCTDPKNILQHFFLQALEQEFPRELEANKNLNERVLYLAIENAPKLSGSARTRAASIVKEYCGTSLLTNVRLTDLRNKAVFEVYRQCGVTIDTYFERYSSPHGSEEQNASYSHIAHGDARATATQTVDLSNALNWMQMLKRFFLVYDALTTDVNLNETNLNWIGAMWKTRIDKTSMGDLVWELFLDLWYIEAT